MMVRYVLYAIVGFKGGRMNENAILTTSSLAEIKTAVKSYLAKHPKRMLYLSKGEMGKPTNRRYAYFTARTGATPQKLPNVPAKYEVYGNMHRTKNLFHAYFYTLTEIRDFARLMPDNAKFDIDYKTGKKESEVYYGNSGYAIRNQDEWKTYGKYVIKGGILKKIA